MLITIGGILIRTRGLKIRELGRATQGVTLSARRWQRAVGLQRVVETDADRRPFEPPTDDAGDEPPAEENP